ncbi:MAG: hypothetical protein ACXWFB_10245, partial [Nitrososphaeraceae archaeon]
GFVIALSFIGNANFLMYWLPVFYIGITTFMHKANLISRNEFCLTLFFFVSFCLYKYPMASLVYMFIPVVCIVFYADYKVKVFNFFGKMSYSIYLIHPLLGASLINILSHYYYCDFAKVIVIVTGFLVTLIASYIMYLVIESPSKRLSASIKYNNCFFSLFKS